MLCLLTGRKILAAPLELTQQESLSLDQDAHYLTEKQPILNFEEARLLHFPLITRGSPNFGWTDLTFWLRTELIKRNELTYILEIGYPLLDELDIYIEREGQLVAHHVLGDHQGGTKRLKNAIKPAFEFPHEPGNYQITIRVRSSSSVQVPMTLLQEDTYHERMLEDFSTLFGYVGAVTIMIIYNAFISLKTRSRAYFHYVAFITLFLMLQVALNGFGQVYLWPEAGSNLIIGHFSYILDYFCYQFTRSFLGLKNRPALDRFLQGMAALSALGFILSLFLPYGLSVRIMAAFTISTAIGLLVVAALTAFVDRTHEGKFYLLAWGCFLVGCVIYLSKQLGWLPYNALTHNAFMIGNITQIALLSFGLADRFNRLQQMAREADQARAEAEAELSLSLKTRVYLVSDMAHRLNNPLNYISTNQANLNREMDDLHKDMNHIIEEWHPRQQPDLYEMASRHINQKFELMKESMSLIEDGIRRSASSVIAIRQLSGVDGYQLDRMNIQELLDLAQQRIMETAGKAAVARFEIKGELTPVEVYTNRFAVPMVIELIFRSWLSATSLTETFTIGLTASSSGKPSLLMTLNYASRDQATHIVEHILPFLNQILRPYESMILCVQTEASLSIALNFGQEKPVATLREVA
jgi:diguanylate cyclase